MQIRELLGNDDLAAAANWADEIKSERPETVGWHFVDIPMNAAGFSEARDCYHPNDKHANTQSDHHNCVVNRIEMFKKVLADRGTPRSDRIEALKFLVHFVGDIHQPLHAIGEARGGNDIHVVEFGSVECGSRPCNLHFVWDIGLIDYAHSSGYPPFAAEGPLVRLNGVIISEHLERRSGGTAEQWVNESFQLAHQVWVKDGSRIDHDYFWKNLPVLNQQLALAGLRLATLLNETLGARDARPRTSGTT